VADAADAEGGAAGGTLGADLLKRLQEDALLVAGFGLRAGKLADSGLPEAIRAAAARPDLDWGAPETLRLQREFEGALRAIQPVTLVDLRAGWNPFGPVVGRVGWRRWSNAASRIFFVVVAIVLMAMSVHYTQWLKRAEATIALFEDGVVAEELAQYHAIVDRFMADGAPPGALEAATARAEFVDALRDARRRSDALRNAQTEYAAVIENYYRFVRVYYDLQFEEMFRDYLDYTEMMASAGLQRGPPGGLPAGSLRAVCLDMIAPSMPDPAAVRPAGGRADPFTRLNGFSVDDTAAVSFLRCLTGAAFRPGVLVYDEADLRQNIERVGLWVLPAVFGMLGAVVYQLRAALDRMRPDPRFWRAVMRTALGGLAGIAFGWIWTPDGASGASAMPLGAYALAFVIGYSIDVFYALLDRVVTTLSSNVGRREEQKGGQPAT